MSSTVVRPTRIGQPRRPGSALLVAGFGSMAAAGWFVLAGPGGAAGARLTVLVFGAAVVAWVTTGLDQTFVALTAALVLVLAGVLDATRLFASMGDPTIWLLIAAFVLAAGVGASGLTARVTAVVIRPARTVRQLAHLLTGALVLSAFAVPATSGRAALALPVFTALARILADRPRVVRALAVLIPSVILLSAVATLTGAGAHVVTNQILLTTTGRSIGFGQWLLLGTPLAVLSAHVTAELVLLLFTRRIDRRTPLRISPGSLGAGSTGRLTPAQCRTAAVLIIVIAAWATEPLHGVPAALVALAGALTMSAPGVGAVNLDEAVATVPWSLLLFMAGTAVLGAALSGSGAAPWLAGAALGWLSGVSPAVLLVAVVSIGVVAHLVIQSRTARSAVLVPLVIPAAVAAGLNPVAVAFASTAAAGFCHTLTSSAKPVAIFARIDGVPSYRPADLLRLSACLGPLTGLLVIGCALWLWPYLGLPLR